MKNVFLLLILFLIGNAGFCEFYFAPTTYSPNYMYRPNSQVYKPRGSYSQRAFNNLERKMLMNNFAYETPKERLNRMEEATFGAIQSGDNYSRYRALKRAMRENRRDYYSPNHYGLRRRFYNSFRGMPTGFTPPIQTPNYYNIPDNYSHNLQSGIKIKIIDD